MIISFEHIQEHHIEGSPIEIEGLTVLNGRNGVGKTRICNTLRSVIAADIGNTVFEIRKMYDADNIVPPVCLYAARKQPLDNLSPSILGIINSIVPGSFEFFWSEEFYRDETGKREISSLPAGSKIFATLKIFLEHGLLTRSTTLIFDGVESYLHPEYQTKLAELIVLLVKELQVTTIVTVYNTDFMLALDANMRKYNIAEQSHFYTASLTETGNTIVKCVDDHMEIIYQDFLDVFSRMKQLRDYYAFGDDEWYMKEF